MLIEIKSKLKNKKKFTKLFKFNVDSVINISTTEYTTIILKGIKNSIAEMSKIFIIG